MPLNGWTQLESRGQRSLSKPSRKLNPPRHRAEKRKVETSCKRQTKIFSLRTYYIEQSVFMLAAEMGIVQACENVQVWWSLGSMPVSMGIFSRVENARERDATPVCPPCRHPHMMKSLRGRQREQVTVPVTHSNLTSLSQVSESSCLGFCFCISPDKDTSSSALTIRDTLEHYL